jgi:hypothetical protein
MIGVLLLAAAFELEAAGGVAFPSPPKPSVVVSKAAAIQLRGGIDFLDHLTLSAAILGVPGSDAQPPSQCGNPCYRQETFKALSGFAIARLHTSANLQAFADLGIGVGHLINLSGDDYFENPPLGGQTGPAFLLGGGGRWFVGGGIAIGVEAAWTLWTRVSRSEFVYGSPVYPARDDLTVSAVLLLFSVGWSSARN